MRACCPDLKLLQCERICGAQTADITTLNRLRQGRQVQISHRRHRSLVGAGVQHTQTQQCDAQIKAVLTSASECRNAFFAIERCASRAIITISKAGICVHSHAAIAVAKSEVVPTCLDVRKSESG